MIELKQIVKKYGSKRALQDVTLSIPRGKVIGLVGENGSGKSTLLKLIAGLLTPNAGSATFDGEPIARQVAAHMAYMSDTDSFYPYFTVQQLIDFYDSQFDDFDVVKAKEILQFLNMSLDSKLKNLSKGNRGRVKIAVTLAREADYYLLDEPFSGLDPMVRDDIAKGLIRFTDPERQTIIMSTHEIREVEPLLDEIIVMRGGRVIAHEAVDEIRDFYGIDATSWMVSLFKDQTIGKGVGKMKPVVELKNLSKTIRQQEDHRQFEFVVVSGANYGVPRSERSRENDDDSDDSWTHEADGGRYRH